MKNNRVLIVDDDQDLTSNLKQLLDSEGYRAMAVYDGQTALNLCHDQVFDIGLIDIRLPDTSGLTLVNKLVELLPGFACILMTGYASIATAVEAVKQKNILSYELKPLDMDRLLSIISQISGRIRAEAALWESEERYRALFEQAADSIVIADLNKGNILEFNNKACEILGYTRQEFEGMKISDIDAVESNQQVAEHLKLILKGGSGIFETKMRKKEGEILDIQVNTKVISAAGRKVIQGIWRDITDEKRAKGDLRKAHDELEQLVEERTADLKKTNEQLTNEIKERKQTEGALQKSEENYRSMMEAMKDPVHICSQDFRITYINPVGIERIGFDPTGKHCYKAIHGRSEKCPWCVIEKVLRGEYVDDYEIVSPLDKHIYLVSSAPIFYSDGTFAKMAVYTDITENKSLQDQVIRSERLAATGQLAASIAHEINSPLQAVTLLLDTLKNKHMGNNDLRENFELLQGVYNDIRDIVKNLLDLNRPGKERKQDVNINTVIEKTLALLRSYLLRSKVNVNLDLSSRVPNILASPQQLSHIFLNLINNAIEAMVSESSPNKGNEIDIKSTLRDGNIIIKVFDNGPGLSDKDFHHIFDPFYTTKKQMGLGVGLSICHDILSDHGGEIQAENGPEGGAVFTIMLPLISPLDNEEKNNEKTRDLTGR